MGRKIYHITHIDNLPSITKLGLLSDVHSQSSRLDCKVVGLNSIKRRRLTEYQVSCHPGSLVGEYVPFYFCPRSVMLYLLHRGNHLDLAYSGGQVPILHLQADLDQVVDWATSIDRKWAISLGNAGAKYTQFQNSLEPLSQWNWNAIYSNDWRDPIVKELKQSEFLVQDSLPWQCIQRIGVISDTMQSKVRLQLTSTTHKPPISVQPDWYY